MTQYMRYIMPDARPTHRSVLTMKPAASNFHFLHFIKEESEAYWSSETSPGHTTVEARGGVQPTTGLTLV